MKTNYVLGNAVTVFFKCLSKQHFLIFCFEMELEQKIKVLKFLKMQTKQIFSLTKCVYLWIIFVC